MKNVYLVGAILGAVIPVMFFLGVFHTQMVGPMGFIPALFANSAAGGFAADILISSAVFWHFMFTNKEGPTPWPFIVVNLCIGLSCALPAYLYRRGAVKERSQGTAAIG